MELFILCEELVLREGIQGYSCWKFEFVLGSAWCLRVSFLWWLLRLLMKAAQNSMHRFILLEFRRQLFLDSFTFLPFLPSIQKYFHAQPLSLLLNPSRCLSTLLMTTPSTFHPNEQSHLFESLYQDTSSFPSVLTSIKTAASQETPSQTHTQARSNKASSLRT